MMWTICLVACICWSAASAMDSSPPVWPYSQISKATTKRLIFDGSLPTSSTVSLWWDVGQQAYRVDQRSADSQLVQSVLVLFRTGQVFVFSDNSTLCQAFCIPPHAGSSLPVLSVAQNNSQGRTFQVSPLSWLRESSVSPANKRGLLNASVVTTLSTTGAPTLVEANYSYNGQTIAYHSCHFESFLSPGRVDPAALVAPSWCRGASATYCYVPLDVPSEGDPFSVMQGCFFAEAVAPFGYNPPDSDCICV